MKVNFSIPVDLFDYRESENSLYSYAKLKIFYIGQTGDKRLFTKKFSDNLLKSLPYVPVVGFYDEEEEDFKGHNPEIQHIYGIVPEDTEIEYIKEDNKEYAVCDVILYTGRTDKTGEIAQKIVGKQHSLELNPNNTTYVINRDAKGKLENIEFKSGSLLGLSILGDGEKPAFSGSGFFNENSHLMEVFENFRKEFEKFTKEQGQRGEKMDVKTDIITTLEEEVENVIETEAFKEETTESPEEEEKEEAVEEETEDKEEEIEDKEEEKEEEEIFTEKEKFLIKFMRETEEEIQRNLMEAFYETFGENVYPIQWSIAEKKIVFVNFEEHKYYRSEFNETEEGVIQFGELTEVRMRFLSDLEIEKLWPKDFVEHETGESEQQEDKGTEKKEELSSNQTNGEEAVNEEEQNSMKVIKEKEEFSSAALNSSERAELEAFRRERKIGLVISFEDDLKKDFLEALKVKVDEFTYEELDTVLSKEFTRISKKENKIKKPNTFVYTADTNSPSTRTEAEIVSDLVNKYKTRK